jgi:hypothetical protein
MSQRPPWGWSNAWGQFLSTASGAILKAKLGTQIGFATCLYIDIVNQFFASANPQLDLPNKYQSLKNINIIWE